MLIEKSVIPGYTNAMLLNFLLLAAGLLIVIKGADFLIDGASSLAKRSAVPEIVIGLTIVAFGTSAPELVVNIFSSIAGKSDLVLGNVIGSNIFNTLVILGITALIYPIEVQHNSVRKEIPFSFAAVLLFFLLANDGLIFQSSSNSISRIDGLIFLVFFILFLYYTFRLSKTNNAGNVEIKEYSLPLTWFFILAGFTGLFIGGKLLVDNAVEIARQLQVSEKLIGLTIVAAGTSLPELATSVMAVLKKRHDLAVGNVVGSNIFNILFILGVSSQVSPVSYSLSFNLDLMVFASGTIFLLIAMFTGKKRSLDRWEGAILLLTFIAYTIYILIRK